jgi:hypothetical protein
MAEKEKSQEELIQERMRKAKAESEAIQKKYDEVLKEMDEKGYGTMSYTKGDVVTIPGTLFGNFVNYVAEQRKFSEVIQNSMGIMLNSIELRQNDTDEFTLMLMKQHIANCEAGNASTKEEVDKEGSKEKIKKKD